METSKNHRGVSPGTTELQAWRVPGPPWRGLNIYVGRNIGTGPRSSHAAVDNHVRQANVVLSGNCVRFAIIPWHPSLTSPARFIQVARGRFRAMHEDASGAIAIDRPRFGDATIACLQPREVEEVVASAIGIPMRRITSTTIVPLVIGVANRFRKQIGPNDLLVVVETNHVTALSRSNTSNPFLISQPAPDIAQALPVLIARWKLEHPGSAKGTVHVFAPLLSQLPAMDGISFRHLDLSMPAHVPPEFAFFLPGPAP